MTTRIRFVTLAFTLAAAAAACGSSSSSSTPPAGSSSSSTASSPSAGGGTTVTISDFKFTPATLTVKAGTKVTFVNDGATPHTATSDSGGAINSGNLTHGQSYTFTFTKPGTYQYTCTIHPFMKGTITVQ
jgi:amicyanin